ncbi:MAG: ribonuclease III [Actinomycetota bacterium]|nr:ribonuclease III [Actinomycetota bacterium]
MGKGRDNAVWTSFRPHLTFNLLDLLAEAAGDRDPDGGQGGIGSYLAIMPSLRIALTHKSAALENPALEHNERLEFLGDALLQARVSEALFTRYQDRDEGYLTVARSALVNTDSLAAIARDLGLDQHLVLGQGERNSGGAKKRTILAGALEAVVAAIWLDVGLEAAAAAIDRTVLADLERLDLEVPLVDAKSQLQIHFAKAGLAAPRYSAEMTGPQHAPKFVARVSLEGGASFTGRGGSKKEAEQRAARAALDALAAGGANRA